jgi:hypothetical protein
VTERVREIIDDARELLQLVGGSDADLRRVVERWKIGQTKNQQLEQNEK